MNNYLLEYSLLISDSHSLPAFTQNYLEKKFERSYERVWRLHAFFMRFLGDNINISMNEYEYQKLWVSKKRCVGYLFY